MFRSRPVD